MAATNNVQFSEDENEVVFESTRYFAHDVEAGSCNGCSLKMGFGCKLAERLHTIHSGEFQMGRPLCQEGYRKDGRNIVWKLK